MRRLARLVLALAAGALALALPAAASAHPLGNFTTNHYLGVFVSPEATLVDFVVDFAEVPSIEVLREIDLDRDGLLSEPEADTARRSLCVARLPDVSLRLDGAPIPLELRTAGVALGEGVGGLPTIRLVCGFAGAGIARSGGSLVVDDAADAASVGWREIVLRGSGLSVEPRDAGGDVSQRLSAYPEDLLSQPLDERSLAVSLLPGGPRVAPPAIPDAWPLADGPAASSGEPAPAAAPGGVAAEFAGLPDLSQLGVGSALLGLLAAAVAGAGHALSPGHGKAVMAAYLVGSRGRTRDAMLLGATVTVSHTAGVILLAAVVLVASDVLPPDRLYPIVGAASGLAVTVIGVWLLLGCIRRYRAARDHRLEHGQGHAHPHRHANGDDHAHGEDHRHAPAGGDGMPGLRGLLALGIAGGLVPSTAALLLLLAAVAAGQPAYGLAMALAFGAGMALTLTGIGLTVVRGKQLLAGRMGAGMPRAALVTAGPWVVAFVVLAGGVVLTGQALATRL